MEGNIFSLDMQEMGELDGALFIRDKILLWENLTEENRNRRIPFVPEYMQIQTKADISILCTHGEAVVNINFRKHVIKPGTLCIIISGTIFEPLYTSDDFRCAITTLGREFFMTLDFGTLDIMTIFNTLRHKFSFSLTDTEAAELTGLYHSIGETIKNSDKPYRMNILRGYVSILYFTIIPVINRKEEEAAPARLSRQEEIFVKFMTEVERNYKRERSIKFYADRLCLTPKYLSSVIYSVSKRLAGEWINDYVMLEARAMLHSNSLSIQQISDSLNFPNQSFFGKYFKRHAGVSPKEYRKKNSSGRV